MNATVARGLIRLARPHQYLKNLFVLLPLFFGWKLSDPSAKASRSSTPRCLGVRWPGGAFTE